MTPLAALLLISWTAPTHNTNGTPLTDLDGFVIYRSQSLASLESSPLVEVGPNDLSCALSDPTSGTWYFGVKARNALDIYSVMSNVVTKVVDVPPPPPPPPPPADPVTVDTLVMEAKVGSSGPWLVRSVGAIPVGTACLGAPMIPRSGADWYRVPRDKVTLTKRNVKPNAILVALCS